MRRLDGIPGAAAWRPAHQRGGVAHVLSHQAEVVPGSGLERGVKLLLRAGALHLPIVHHIEGPGALVLVALHGQGHPPAGGGSSLLDNLAHDAMIWLMTTDPGPAHGSADC